MMLQQFDKFLLKCPEHLQKFILSPYFGEAGLPAMAINGPCNKRLGPGGGTRRLHQSSPNGGCGGAEIGSTNV